MNIFTKVYLPTMLKKQSYEPPHSIIILKRILQVIKSIEGNNINILCLCPCFGAHGPTIETSHTFH